MARFWTALAIALISLITLPIFAKTEDTAGLIPYTTNDNELIYLENNRKPALYTGDFGDCLGTQKSSLNLDRFDAALYIDNMTITFHISGDSNLTSEAVMLYLGVYAYGESRFDIAWNPCGTDQTSLCPVKSTVPIEISAQIPLGPADVVGIPNIAYSIPDFEGQAILRIFANSTQSQIACYSAVVTNGATFRQPESVGSILGIFALIAIVASIATSVYGQNVPEMRTHYAHSLSVLVVFAVYHHIYFTGALSMNWPSVLVAFWSNYAWSAGMIYTSGMQDSLSKFMGKYSGDTLAVGAAATGAYAPNVGGGYDIHKIYKRAMNATLMKRELAPVQLKSGLNLVKRSLINSTSGYKYYGSKARTGLPLPGNFSGFAGTLSQQDIPAANALLTGLIWLLICILIVAGSITIFKFVVDGLSRFKVLKTERLNFFRAHWMRYVTAAVLRICYIAFFMMTFLTIFQFTYDGAPGAIAIGAIIFVLFLLGIFGIVGYACYYRMRKGTWVSEKDVIFAERSKSLKYIPWYHFYRGSKVQDSDKVFSQQFPSWRISRNPEESETPVHDDEDYILKFGWLASRFRRSRWWFFALWAVYEFVRACFLGGASGHALVQVFCLLIIEFVAFMVIVKLKPYEGQRLNIVMVYLLGFSKVTTVALSAAFDIDFNIARIPATAIGIIIIVIQGLLTIALLICIVLSAISSYFSITRNREQIRPRRWMPYRERYFAHIQQAATDRPKTPPPLEPVMELPQIPKEPYFSVNSVKRMAKIEDEDAEFQKDILNDPRNEASDIDLLEGSVLPAGPSTGLKRTGSIANSMRSNMSRMSGSSLPYGAVVHRGSWSTRDFQQYQNESSTDVRYERYSRGGYAPGLETAYVKSPSVPISRHSSRESIRARSLKDNSLIDIPPTGSRTSAPSSPVHGSFPHNSLPNSKPSSPLATSFPASALAGPPPSADYAPAEFSTSAVATPDSNVSTPPLDTTNLLPRPQTPVGRIKSPLANMSTRSSPSTPPHSPSSPSRRFRSTSSRQGKRGESIDEDRAH
ncbi:TRP-domain-containing protein [Microthyrium microscopicum]|uniref:TRP-domain-containing protein n=1 Tax=Microthyrium microscopicum TaxID=703497 RepID=A0A6A6U9W3_9PEZI|nr:TRP-domain-containing protein [Microthyrium microscopicum]